MLSILFIAAFSAIILEGGPGTEVLAAKPEAISKVSEIKNKGLEPNNLNSQKGDKHTNIVVTTLKKHPIPATDIEVGISGWSKDKEVKDLKEGDPNPGWMK